MSLRRAFVISSLSLSVACGGSSPDTTETRSTSTSGGESAASTSAFTLAEAIDLGVATYPNAMPFVVERDDVDGRPALEVKLLEGTTVHVIKFALDDRSVLSSEDKPIGSDELEEYTLLAAEMSTRANPLHAGLRFMIDAYGEDALDEVELEMHGVTLVLEAAVNRDGEHQVQVHDPDTGAFMMTEH